MNTSGDSSETIPFEVIEAYTDEVKSFEISLLGKGNINDTYLIKHPPQKTFILQRINSEVFADPRVVVGNTARVSDYFTKNVDDADLVIPQTYTTLFGKNYFQDKKGGIWRGQHYIENSITFEKTVDRKMAFQVGECLATFHTAVKDMKPTSLSVVLPGFHDLPGYLRAFDAVASGYMVKNDKNVQKCCEIIERFRSMTPFLENAKKAGTLKERIIHGDPKLSNILFDKNTSEAISIIDLDTVGVGLVLYDIGDCLRSVACNVGESTFRSDILCDMELVENVLRGYFSKAKLTGNEKNAIFEAFHLITYELGIRFLSDYLLR